MSTLEIIAVAVSFLGIWLTARRWVLCWPVNLLACALYFKIFLDVRLYSDMVLQALFGIAILYGWIVWARGKEENGEIVVETLTPGQACAGLAIGAAGALAIGWIISRYTDAALPWMDATLSSFSLVAQYWTARRHAASWLLWIVVDACYVGMFAIKGLWLTGGLYAAMIVLAAMGYTRWRRAKHAAIPAV
ncbi:nicotinamide riboside transporter PnuC [Novosphingobium sp. JCM 18896]|uniref:nicotinamide riboside transporter PnuC n=1 Tax=Novosphingobium sp. JCM 18896 TaxID=2989731 RepID=UPI0022235B7B|nr:nicotinamide riboside transporter PnuC [Novosphingobium sp. JCM 18896]MCW1430643.1 nicotinamide riboside transporter PnuC [Novosphingobium sp. JCM 18896]